MTGQKKNGTCADLINSAEQWHYGVELNFRAKTSEFLGFVIDQVAKTELFNQLLDEINSIRALHLPIQ